MRRKICQILRVREEVDEDASNYPGAYSVPYCMYGMVLLQIFDTMVL